MKQMNCNTVLVPFFLPLTLSKIQLRMTYSRCQDYNVHSILKLLAGLSCTGLKNIMFEQRYEEQSKLEGNDHSYHILLVGGNAISFTSIRYIYLFRWSEFHTTATCKHSNLRRRFKRDYTRNVFCVWVGLDMSYKYLHDVQFKLNIFQLKQA